jgi:hypothetical protein
MKYFLTFGNNDFKNQTIRLNKETQQTGWFDKVVIEDIDTINDLYKEHKAFIDSNARGYGYWIWKPYIIYKLLLNINDNDYIFYADAGSSVLPHKYNRLLEYIDILDSTDRPILTFSSQYLEKNFQKLSNLNYFNLSNNIDFLNSYQVESGIVICKKNNFVIDFVKNWLDLCIVDNHKLLIDSTKDNENEHFIEHRHDQSILSMLCKINKTPIICCNEAYGMGPFFSSRLTDDLPRRFAPDLFRTDSRYDPYKHFTWNEWLNDYPDSRFNYDLLLQHIDKLI